MDDRNENTNKGARGNRTNNETKNWRRGNRHKYSQSREYKEKNKEHQINSHSSVSQLKGLKGFEKLFNDKKSNAGPSNNANREVNRPHKIGFKKLEEFLTEEPDQLVVRLLSAMSGFIELLHTPSLSHDYIVLIMRILSKMSECSFDSNKTKLLQAACTDIFVLQLTNLIFLLPLQTIQQKKTCRYFWNDPDNFFQNLKDYCEMILHLSPSTACDVLPKVIYSTISVIPQLENLSHKLQIFKSIQVKLDMCKEEMASKSKTQYAVVDESELEPPNNFREMSLYPLPLELINAEKAFVRPNIVEGPYKNVDHYLDIQFRLLREDFVKPLREGISEYFHNDNKKPQNVKIYKNVKFISPQLVNAVCGVRIQLEIGDKKSYAMKLENSRSFMFGSLMCFTKNNFKTIIFGKIINRDTELLQKGQLVVEFEPGVCDIEYNINYIMVESKVYFEPYYHVLKALKELSDSNFPMEKFIINVSTVTESVQYKIQQYSDDDDDDDDHYDRKHEVINRCLQKKLNDSQYVAYQHAMNQSFSIIQGPPGTGKTFLGLEIAKSLLQKRFQWHHGRYPLLVVCFTNHALDQFLEGLLSTTKDIVRVGGQSKNKNLQQYNIRNIRKFDKSNARAFYEARDAVLSAQLLLQKCYEQIDVIDQDDGVVNILKILKDLPELQGTWFENINEKEFQEWLFVQDHFQKKQVTIQMKDEEDIEKDENFCNELNEDPNKAHFVELDDLVLHIEYASCSSYYIISIRQLETEIKQLHFRREQLNLSFEGNYIEIYKLDHKLMLLCNSMEYLQLRMKERKSSELEKLINYELPHHIHPDDRWKLYFYWLELFKESKKMEIIKHERDYQLCFKAYEELREIEDIEVMRKKLIVGLTTTGAARLQGSLRALKSPIVIVEEAAEIMESHVVTSLTKDCKHLILIGDHQQLRPNTADYLMEKRYLLGISLFERMVRNNIHCNVLSVQHRMRPEIAKLIAPNIYPHLKNHESVYHFPPIRGVNSCIYFITHTNPEELYLDNTKVNKHEVTFLLRFAKYLIQNGYQPDEITILAAYTGQMFAMFKERKKYELLKDVRICVLDSYQGEESKIILLSLVRNNNEGKIGFLSIENRVCVALSRAREGLYIMGNMDLLCSKSTIWPKIRSVLEEQNSLATSLTLRCQIHYDKITNISNEADFFKVSEGGCDLICRQGLTCGHQCLSQCHTLNRDHNLYQCKEKCRKILCDNGHLCPKFCFEKCSDCVVPMMRRLKCGHEKEFPCYQTEFICTHPVSAELPCKHEVTDKPCYIPTEIHRCPYPCDTRLDTCGHSCEKKCHINDDPDHLEYKCLKPCVQYRKNCALKEHICPNYCFEECPDCEIKIKKRRSCSHFYDVACSADVEKVECKKPCKRMLPCGHPCKRQCSEPCGNCNIKVQKIVPVCGHEIQIECSKEPNRRYCKNNCSLKLQCGHQCKNKCNENCTATCTELVDNSTPLPCGHSSQIPCSINNSMKLLISNNESANYSAILTQLSYCRNPCLAQLECGHTCSGSCGECYQGRIHKICSEDCGVNLICGHKCAVPCRQACPPCGQLCMYQCPHSKCKKRCGDVCTPCKEPCPRKCKHGKCKSWCGAKCTVPPCEVACEKKLRCGHLCIGFCGEPCPPLCMICNKDELLDFCLGYEEEQDARFVLLQECNHVIESRGMKMWLEQNENEINVKRCPKCRTPLTITRRFKSYIQTSIEEISKIKLRFFGEARENRNIQETLRVRIRGVGSHLKEVSEVYRTVHSSIAIMLEPKHHGRKQTISKIMGQILTSKIQILENICDLFDDISSKQKTARCIKYIDFLLARLIQVKYRMTSQEVNDYDVEVKRLRRILQLSEIEETYPSVLSKNSYKQLSNILYANEKYDINNDENIKDCLNKLAKEMGGTLIVSDKELQDIVKAIGVRHGAWYKCPNGHLYAIGECGGAMQVSKCADCGVPIGGTNHALLSGNQHSGIDGSNYSAWSMQANLANYELRL